MDYYVGGEALAAAKSPERRQHGGKNLFWGK